MPPTKTPFLPTQTHKQPLKPVIAQKLPSAVLDALQKESEESE